MNIPTKKAFRFLLVSASAITLSACGWVDSTGTQGTTFVVDTPVVSGGALRNAQPLAVTENTAVSVSLAGEGSQLDNWLWNNDSADESNRCISINGFDISHAATFRRQ